LHSYTLAAVTSDSTVVYYHLHRGVVPPPEDKFSLLRTTPGAPDDDAD
jgi:hypothetical protein